MEKIVLENFDHWIKGLEPKEARIAVFEQIRDIPYALVPEIKNPLDWGASILSNHCGSCSPKHYLLGFLFGKLGIPVKYATYPFKWSEQKIKYPDELKKLADGSPIGYHCACKAQISGLWILVDATWDMALKKAGFPVNIWDGLSDTQNAVIPLEEIIHETLEERLDYVRAKKSKFTEQEKAIYAEFIPKFNAWLESLR